MSDFFLKLFNCLLTSLENGTYAYGKLRAGDKRTGLLVSVQLFEECAAGLLALGQNLKFAIEIGLVEIATDAVQTRHSVCVSTRSDTGQVWSPGQ